MLHREKAMGSRRRRVGARTVWVLLPLLLLSPPGFFARAGAAHPAPEPKARVLQCLLLGAGRLPNLKSLMGAGAWILDARVAGPAVTLPAHITMVPASPRPSTG